MCYSDDARPPAPPGTNGGVATRGDFVLEASDGNRFMAYAARAGRPSGVGVVVLPDIRGLHHFYKELVDRFAETGIDAVAFDYFGRTAGIGARDEEFAWRPHVEQTTGEGIDADVAAAIAFLRGSAGGAVERVFTVGFCFGGSNSWRQSATQPGLAGAIGFYGQPARVRDLIGEMRAPLLLLVAGADFTPLAEFEQFDQALTAASITHQMVVYEGVPHSFFDRTFAEHRAACDDAWRQILDFVRLPAPV
jgi:carboxymethylenebutenolidase